MLFFLSMACRASSIVSGLVCSYNFAISISSDGNVYSFGNSEFCGHGHEEKQVFPPKMIPSFKHVKSIVVGIDHAVYLNYDGSVFTFGSNEFGQLGIGVEKDILEFTHIPQKVNLPPCKQISCDSGNYSLCLTDEGYVYSFGTCKYGELGVGYDSITCNSPQLIESLKDIEFVESGRFHAFCKSINNEVYCWGSNSTGELGLGNNEPNNSPILNPDLSNKDVVDIKCGILHSILLTANQDVLSCGNNDFGQIGRDTEGYDGSSTFQKIEELSDIVKIECGDFHSLFIDINNDLYVLGYNDCGQLGLGDKDERLTPIKHPSLSNIIDISSEGYQSFVKTSNNEIYAFGSNDYLQLGIKTEEKHQLTPIRVFEDNEDIWCSKVGRPKAKSARFIVNKN